MKQDGQPVAAEVRTLAPVKQADSLSYAPRVFTLAVYEFDSGAIAAIIACRDSASNLGGGRYHEHDMVADWNRE